MSLSEETVQLINDLSNIRIQKSSQDERIILLSEKLEMARKARDVLSRREKELSRTLDIKYGGKISKPERNNLTQVLGTLFNQEEEEEITELTDD